MKSSFVKKLLKKRRNGHQKSSAKLEERRDRAGLKAGDSSCTSALEEATVSQDEALQPQQCRVELHRGASDETVPKYVQMTFSSPRHDQQPRSEKGVPSEPAPAEAGPRPESIAKAAAALDNYGNDQFQQGEYDGAMASYSKALKLKTRSLRSLPCADATSPETDAVMASVATSINNIGYLKQRSGATAKETMAAYQDSLRIKQEILGRDSLGCGKTLNNIGSVYFLTKDYHQAMEAYREACDIMIFNLGPNHVDVATVYSNMGDVHLALGDSKSSCDLYRQALTIRWEQLGERDAKVVRLLEKVALIEMGELDQVNIGVQTSSSEAEDEDDSPREDAAALDNLMNEVKRDMNHVDSVKRQLALDMVKEKVQMKREMRAINDGIDDISDILTIPRRTPSPLTPEDRTQALAVLKGRLKRIRDSKRNLAEDLGKAAKDDTSSITPNGSGDTSDSTSYSPTSTEPAYEKENVDADSSSDNHHISRSRALARHAKAKEMVSMRLERLQAA